MNTPMKHNALRTPPHMIAGIVLWLVVALITALVFLHFRGHFVPKVQLTMLSGRAGLVMDPGSPVTFNGVHIGRVATIEQAQRDGEQAAKFTLNVDPKYIRLIPANVDAEIKTTTAFGNKYVSFSSPEDPLPQRVSSDDVIDATHVTTEMNTLFETVMNLTEHVDPVKLNQTLTATAQALDGFGNRLGDSIEHGNAILDDLNPQMPRIREDIGLLADMGEVYAAAAPDLFDGLDHATTTVATLNELRGSLDEALMAAIGFGHTGADVFERGGPFMVRTIEDLIPTSALLDEYSPSLFCAIRNYHDVAPRYARAWGGNGYSIHTTNEMVGAGNPYVYPDNLPRLNASGGPEGRPGCWQPITKDLWPAPYLVVDTGASNAPYNHFELGQPFAIEHIWGRQVGEYTINP
ncbi:MCE family protein [Mycobacterium sp. IS-3022]|uniref:MCE family protein n=1 Tax=Mycobacterium sp. IS-3022 TaxID=1772277 RepID=UPI0007415783|nr:MCE family protein [Mycobacterium sp. IS-3022]KUI01826.1 MCE-family protein MCE1A [Mycobacterium sp. IS-3022]